MTFMLCFVAIVTTIACIMWAIVSRRSPPTNRPCDQHDLLHAGRSGFEAVEYDLLEVLGDVPALPDDEHLQWEARTMRRMQAIEAVGDRDGWQCGICHAPAEHLYFVELHDDGTLCCAVCTQLLDAGALE